MSKDRTLEIMCTNSNCKLWFPSPVYFPNLAHFNVNAVKGLRAQCPQCSKIVTFTHKNIRIRKHEMLTINKSS